MNPERERMELPLSPLPWVCLKQVETGGTRTLGTYFSSLCAFCLDGRVSWMRGLATPCCLTGIRTSLDTDQEASDKQASAPRVGEAMVLLACLLLVSLSDLRETKRFRSLTRNHRS